MIIKRDIYLNRLIERKNNGQIKVITGIRRCGKSYLLFELYYSYLLSEGINPNQIIRIALDSEENEEETGTAESGTTGTQGTDADIKEEKAPKTTFDNNDSLDLDSEEYDLDGF